MWVLIAKTDKDTECWQREPTLVVCFAAQKAALSHNLMECRGRGAQNVSCMQVGEGHEAI